MTEQRIQKLRRKLQEARYAAVSRNPGFAAPLLDMLYFAVGDVPRISTNGSCIYVNPNWLQSVALASLEFMLAHQQMHIQLGHIGRSAFFSGERFHLACDITANSHMRDLGYTDEQLPGVGRIYHTTFYPVIEGNCLSAEEAFRCTPFDPDSLKDKKSARFWIDFERYWEQKEDRGEHGTLLLSPDDEDPEGLILDRAELKRRIRGVWKPPGHPGEVRADPGAVRGGTQKRRQPGDGASGAEDKAVLNTLRMIKAADEHRAETEAFMRVWQRPNDPRTDWRMLLNTFLQERQSDYSFLPPDRRQADSEFFLPDFNETELAPQTVVFAVDSSGSVTDELLAAAYSEICGAIEQLDGGLTGILLFFDTRVYRPIPFSSVEELENAIPRGGGGTDFSCLFSFLSASSIKPAGVVIFTDGKGEFPDESAAENLPVLWLLSRDDVSVPWGRCTWMKEE